MAEQSPELHAVFRRAITAMQQRDMETLGSLFARSDALRLIGTDPREWIAGHETVVGLYAAQLEELGPFEVSFEDLEAFEHGGFGWVASRFSWDFGDGRVFSVRVTAVFVLESGVWRIIQLHGSEGVLNEESLGVELTTSLEDLLESLGPETEEHIRGSVSEGTVTLMFTDIEGSSELSEQVGDQAWAKLIEWHDDTLRRITGSEGGTVVKTLGDGAMLAFGSARSAVRSAVGIQEAIGARDERPPLQIRIGVHTGDAVITGTDYLGHTVNKAARIAAAADGGQIRVSSVVRELVGDTDDIRFGEPIPVELKGLSGIHLISPVHW